MTTVEKCCAGLALCLAWLLLAFLAIGLQGCGQSPSERQVALLEWDIAHMKSGGAPRWNAERKLARWKLARKEGTELAEPR